MNQVLPEDYWTAEQWNSELDWKVRRRHRLMVEFYGALCAYTAGDDRPENPSSLATCKRSPTSGGPAGTGSKTPESLSADLTEPEYEALPLVFRLGVEDVGRAVEIVQGGGDRLTAIYQSLGRDDERIRRVLALLERDEVAHALRLATCGRRSVQLECPEDAGGCGHKENYVPIHCGSRLCPDCTRRNIGQLIEEWTPAVQQMDYPTFATFTIGNVSDAAKGRDAIVGAFGRLRRRTIPFEGERNSDGTTKRWCWWQDGGQPADRWKINLKDAGADDLARHLQKSYVHHEYEDITGVNRGRAIPFDEVVDGGLYAVDVKQKGPDEYNVHLHTVVDMAYVPQAALSSVWEDLTGDPVVDVRRIYDRSGGGIESALAETVAYAAKAPEFESTEDAVEFATEMKGKALVHPFGSLHGSATDAGGLLRCARCDQSPRWWTYRGLVDGGYDNMGKNWDKQGENDPPDSAA